MSGIGTSNQTQSSQSQSSPWAPTQPLLQNILGNLSNVNQGITPYQSSAVQNLQGSASGIPNFGPTVAGTASAYLNPGSDQNQAVIGATQRAQNTLSPYLQSNYLNPFNNPGMANILNTVGNNINGEFAAAGRDLSPANSRAVAAGETDAAFNQYNQNVGAQQNATNQYLSSLLQGNQALQGNIGFGIQGAGNVPGFMLAPGQAQLGAGNAGFNLPLANIGGVEGLTLPIAGLGGQTSGTASGSYTASPLADALGIGKFLWGG